MSVPSSLLVRLGSATGTIVSYLKTPLLASSGIAAVLSGLLYVKQNELIYPRNLPSGARTDIPTPKEFSYDDYEDLRIPTPDGEVLAAYLIRPRNRSRKPNVTILMLHGNAGNIGHRVPIALRLQEDVGCNVLMLEYRGYGASTGKPDEKGLLIDGQTGLQYLRHRADLQDTRIVVYGQSLGGALAIQVVAGNQNDGRIAGLVLENTFTSMKKLIPSAFPPARFLTGLCHQVWPSESVMPSITTVPVLFLSGLRDEIVPPAHMHELHRICRAKKTWKAFPNGTHNDSVLQPGYFESIADFIRRDIVKS